MKAVAVVLRLRLRWWAVRMGVGHVAAPEHQFTASRGASSASKLQNFGKFVA